MRAIPPPFHTLYHYRIRPVFDLLVRREFGYLVGVVTETLVGWNPYLAYLKRWRDDLLVRRGVGAFTMTLDLADPGLSRKLITRGVHEPNATPAFLKSLDHAISRSTGTSLVILDIGANLGYFTLLEAAEIGDKGTVYAFEPVPDNRGILEMNVKQNGLDEHVVIVPTAVGEREGTAKIVLSKRSNLHHIHRSADGTEDRSATVRVQTIDGFLSDHDIDPTSVVGIRMDLEGHESAVFEGISRLLDTDTPLAMYVELHPETLTPAELDRILERLETNGFSVTFAGQDRQTFDVATFDDIREIGGSHVRLVLERGTAVR